MFTLTRTRTTLSAALFTLLACQIGCAGVSSEETVSTTSQPSVPSQPSRTSAKTILSIPKLALKSPATVEKELGHPTQVTAITSTPEQMPGEFRHYTTFSQKDPAQVRYHRGKAVQFTIYVDSVTTDALYLLERLGFQGLPAAPDVEAPAALRWKDKRVGSVGFTEISVENSEFDGSKGWDILTAKVRE
jgi:hypothetical protein